MSDGCGFKTCVMWCTSVCTHMYAYTCIYVCIRFRIVGYLARVDSLSFVWRLRAGVWRHCASPSVALARTRAFPSFLCVAHFGCARVAQGSCERRANSIAADRLASNPFGHGLQTAEWKGHCTLRRVRCHRPRSIWLLAVCAPHCFEFGSQLEDTSLPAGYQP